MLTNIRKIRTLENSSGEMCRLYTEAYRGNWNDLQVQHNFPWKTDDSEKSSQSIVSIYNTFIENRKTNKPHVFPLKECENYATISKRNINYHAI